jgi:ribosomal protein S18 acetylase RimI-like enzyme
MTPEDEPFLRDLYASTRQEELAPLAWSDDEKQTFLASQFAAQCAFYEEQFRDASFQIILLDGEPAGRLYLDRRDDEIRIIDIALLPEHRGQGIGSSIMDDILNEARRTGKAVRIHVEQFNPALRLYERLGFKKVGDTGVYYLMEWS